MLNIQEIFSFVAVAKAGSFTQAGARLGLPKSTVSRHVQNLEERLALNLFQRTTRKLKLTPAGEDFLKQSATLVHEFETLEQNFKSQSEKIEGPLRITCPVEIGVCLLPSILNRFKQKYPHVELQLILEDAVLDLIDARIDVALRGGPLSDSSLKSKKFMNSEFRLYGGIQYLKSNPHVNSEDGLQHAHFLEYSNKPLSQVILVNEKRKLKIPAQYCIQTNSLRMSMEMAIHDMGLCLLPDFMGEHQVQLGHLKPVLKGWATPSNPMHVVYPAQRQLSRKLRAFIDHLFQGL